MKLAIIACWMGVSLQPGFAQANYYQGKTVTIISGTTAGEKRHD